MLTNTKHDNGYNIYSLYLTNLNELKRMPVDIMHTNGYSRYLNSGYELLSSYSVTMG